MAPKSAHCDPIEGPAHGSLRLLSSPSSPPDFRDKPSGQELASEYQSGGPLNEYLNRCLTHKLSAEALFPAGFAVKGKSLDIAGFESAREHFPFEDGFSAF